MHCLNIIAMFWVVVRVPWMIARALLVKLLLCCGCRILNGCKGVLIFWEVGKLLLSDH